MTTYGVIIARFQVPELHLGHSYLIKQVMNKHDKVVILLGISASVPTEINPLSFEVRKKMIQQHFPSVDIDGIYDIPDDRKWSDHVDQVLSKYDGTPVLYGSRKSFEPHYFGKHKLQHIEPVFERSGTDVRKDLLEPIHNSSFRAGIIHNVMNRLPIVYATVDIAVFKNSELLLCRKPWETLWRFPGGFIDPSDSSALAAAQREKREEVGSFEVCNWSYVGSAKIDDPRYKNTKDSILTTVFRCDYVFGSPIADDDIAEVQWFKFDNDLLEIINPIHLPILNLFGVRHDA